LLKSSLGVLGAVLVLVLAACRNGSNGMNVAKGVWGGRNLELLVEDGGATAQFKCGAVGQVNDGLRLDDAAHFDAPGTYDPKVVLGGPRPARYTGRLQGDHLALNVEVEHATIGPFELQRGRAGTFDVCNFAP
jgi:hypothetical protein